MPISAHINRIATAVPPHGVHDAYRDWATTRLGSERERNLFARIAAKSGISQRWSVLPVASLGPGGFYAADPLPGTAARMDAYAMHAPALALEAARGLGPLGRITHLIVASCTGFVAPGLDQILAEALGLDDDVERTLIGFMGCYGAIPALRTARHIVRSDPAARVLVVNVELSSLHLQPERDVAALLAMMQFADGATAALVSADRQGLALERFFTATLPDSAGLITWRIGDSGFVMELSGEVPQRIASALRESNGFRQTLGLDGGEAWAVHPGGRSILDAVEQGLGLDGDALAVSRGVLDRCGNMSSATLMFVLAETMARGLPDRGVAMAFGPGVVAEGFRFGAAR